MSDLAALKRRVRRLIYSNRVTARIWLSPPRRRVCRVTRRTDLVVDGYWRSGNTFTRTAFLSVNSDAEVSSFAHSPYAVREGVRLGLPTMVLVRRPEDSIASYLDYFPGHSWDLAVDEYIFYYRSVLPHLDDALVVRFEDAVADLGRVTRECNLRFGTDFAAFVATPKDVQEVFDEIDGHYARSRDLKGRSARPGGGRVSKQHGDDRLSPAQERRLAEANELYAKALRHARSAQDES